MHQHGTSNSASTPKFDMLQTLILSGEAINAFTNEVVSVWLAKLRQTRSPVLATQLNGLLDRYKAMLAFAKQSLLQGEEIVNDMKTIRTPEQVQLRLFEEMQITGISRLLNANVAPNAQIFYSDGNPVPVRQRPTENARTLELDKLATQLSEFQKNDVAPISNESYQYQPNKFSFALLKFEFLMLRAKTILEENEGVLKQCTNEQQVHPSLLQELVNIYVSIQRCLREMEQALKDLQTCQLGVQSKLDILENIFPEKPFTDVKSDGQNNRTVSGNPIFTRHHQYFSSELSVCNESLKSADIIKQQITDVNNSFNTLVPKALVARLHAEWLSRNVKLPNTVAPAPSMSTPKPVGNPPLSPRRDHLHKITGLFWNRTTDARTNTQTFWRQFKDEQQAQNTITSLKQNQLSGSAKTLDKKTASQQQCENGLYLVQVTDFEPPKPR